MTLVITVSMNCWTKVMAAPMDASQIVPDLNSHLGGDPASTKNIFQERGSVIHLRPELKQVLVDRCPPCCLASP
jgi:hypothetical protein